MPISARNIRAFGINDMIDNEIPQKETRRIERFIKGIAILGILTLIVSVWFAFQLDVETEVTETADGSFIVKGPEADLLGVMRSDAGNRSLEVRGLPKPEAFSEYPEVRYALCAARNDPDTVWEEPSGTMRANLQSEGFDELCAVYPDL